MKGQDMRIGMKVRRIFGEFNGMRIGEVSTVTGLPDAVNPICVRLLDFKGRHLPSCLEPVTEPSKDHQFHVGQPVRCLESSEYKESLKAGNIYQITESRDAEEGRFAQVKVNSGAGWWFANRFEPAYDLEVGCMVRVVGVGFPSYDNLEGRVIKFSAIDPLITIRTDDGTIIDLKPGYLIVLSPAPSSHNDVLRRTLINIPLEISNKFCCMKELKLKERFVFGNVDLDDDDNPLSHKYYVGIDWASAFNNVNYPTKEESKMVQTIDEKKIKELAEQMKDEYVGFDSQKITKHGGGTVFLKKAGECGIERRDITMSLTDEDVKALMKQKGITKSIGTHEIERYSGTYTIGIIKFHPLKKDLPEPNEAV